MVKKILIIFVAVVVIVFVAMNVFNINSNHDKSKYQAVDDYYNMPFELRTVTSFTLKRADVIKQNGEPDEIGDCNDLSYIIYHKEDMARQFIFFNKSTDVLWHSWTCNRIFFLSDFTDIKEGHSTEKDVLKIDKFLSLIFTGEDLALSEHLINNARSLLINYRLIDDNWIVTKTEVIENEPSKTSILIENYYNKVKGGALSVENIIRYTKKSSLNPCLILY
ncbi:hypothetical protein IMX26_12775 [Clostridium sp. 'deep sea']|uniref:hypothetical protein n=1 Tax=Clostridium sp. 'deep sea' TaxID=2779445 RepID=UPI00189641E4|nr:hypothetical protein [Clostridium sp. 'deep sea']QOR34358.1 hypothetical protein IMX26_12775 [Clostridium sp. 'deep sea']